MFKILKYLVFSFALFCVFSIPINNKSLFYHLHDISGPHPHRIIKASKNLSLKIFKTMKNIGSELLGSYKPSNKDKPTSKRKVSTELKSQHRTIHEEDEKKLQKILDESL